jgi:OOP family OmpA-OmpF porin
MSAVKTLAWFGLIGWMAGGTYWHVCRIKQLCDGNPAPTVAVSEPEFSVPSLDIEDGKLSLHSPFNVAFHRSGAQAGLEAVKPQLDALAAYLKANPRRKLTLTGYYSSQEENTTPFENLGLARADALRQYLIALGVPADQLLTEGKLLDNLAFSPQDSTYGAGFAFEAGEPAAKVTEAPAVPAEPATPPAALEKPKGETEQELAASEKFESIFKTMDLYFPLGSSEYIKTEENRKFFDEAKKYLTAHPGKKLFLTGHTDSEGPDDVNLNLSKRRAEAVKKAFERKGIKATQLLADGKGETQPIADNATRAGRKANRRVSILVK